MVPERERASGGNARFSASFGEYFDALEVEHEAGDEYGGESADIVISLRSSDEVKSIYGSVNWIV